MKLDLTAPRSETRRSYHQDRHAVILAGGEGSRLRPLTLSIAGDDRPKQFCEIYGGGTLIDMTRDRVAIGISPELTHFSLTRTHERFYKHALTGIPASRLAIQPENHGTAPAILYSLFRIFRSAPDAMVAFFPSDHYFANDEAMMEHVDSAFETVRIDPDSVVLLGIEPEGAETSYGWIEPVQSIFGGMSRSVSRVNKFWEKPTAGVAEKLLSAGCLWNSFVMVGRVKTFLDMFRRHLPGMFNMFSAAASCFGTFQEPRVIRSIYSWITETNFSSEVLEHSAAELLVMRVGNVGWCDWGEPERVIGTLNKIGARPQWLQAMAA